MTATEGTMRHAALASRRRCRRDSTFVTAAAAFLLSSSALWGTSFTAPLLPGRLLTASRRPGSEVEPLVQQRVRQPDTREPQRESGMRESIWASEAAEKEVKPNRETEDQRRMRREGDRDPDRDLISSKDCRVGSLAGAIVTQIKRKGNSLIRAVGAMSVNQALKSIAVANQMLDKEEGFGGRNQGLAAVPYYQVMKRSEDDDEANVLFLECSYMKMSKHAEEVDKDRQVVAAKNKEMIPQMGAAIKSRILSDGVASVFGVGPDRLNRSIKAMLVAGRYLREDQGITDRSTDGSDRNIALFPSFYEFSADVDKVMRSRIGLRMDVVQLKR
mmetsp:Transcript_85426/g.153807  ORF Transcript_85426/g.153807 Transcript_85426/m.153807 type:complete len:330 (+) Transcript_85426:71-1060(+)